MHKFLKILTGSDIILVIFLLFISLTLFLYSHKTNSQKLVEIFYQNKLIGTFPISKSKIINVDKNIKVEIKNNKVRMLENTCKRQICVKQGWSDSVPIICVPNKVMIKIVSKSKKKMLITY